MKTTTLHSHALRTSLPMPDISCEFSHSSQVCRDGIVDNIRGSVETLAVVFELLFVCALNICQVSIGSRIRKWKLVPANNGPKINFLKQILVVPRPGSIIVGVKTGEGCLFMFKEVFGGGLRVTLVRHDYFWRS